MRIKSFLGCVVAVLLIAAGVGVYVYRQMTRPIVSVIIASYNMGDTLPAAIESIRAQTFTDWELIVVNDGSTDDTARILEAYPIKDPRIRVITNDRNRGLIVSLNKGLARARGRYVARLDADDTSYPDRLARQVRFMEENHLDLCSAGMDTQNDKWTPESWVGPDDLDSDRLGLNLMFGNYFSHPSIMFNRDFVRREGLKYSIDHPNAEDYELWMRMYQAGAKLGIMGGKPVTTYHSSEHSQSWYKKSAKSVSRTKLKALRKIIPDLRDKAADLDKCDLLPMMIEANRETQVMDDKLLTETELQSCIPAIEFVHPNWTTHLYHIKGRHFRRADMPNEKASLVRTPRGVLVEWDNWPAEMFECNSVRCVKTGHDPRLRTGDHP